MTSAHSSLKKRKTKKMKENNSPTREQIVESIVHWSTMMLENGIATEEEVERLIGEGLLKRAIGAVKRGIDKVKDTAKAVKGAASEALHDLLKPNEGISKMLKAMASIARSGGSKLEDVKVYATLGDKVLPVAAFAMKGKRSLILLVSRAAKAV